MRQIKIEAAQSTGACKGCKNRIVPYSVTIEYLLNIHVNQFNPKKYQNFIIVTNYLFLFKPSILRVQLGRPIPQSLWNSNDKIYFSL